MKCKKKYPFGIVYCPTCGAKLVMGRLSLKPLSAPTCHIGRCGRTDDLAQCPECHLWFCKEHDTHECMSQPQTSEMRGRIARAKAKRNVGVAIMTLALFVDVIVLGIWEHFLSSNPSTFMAFVELVAINVSFLALGYVIKRHYNIQLQKLGVHYRSIRPQTARRDS